MLRNIRNHGGDRLTRPGRRCLALLLCMVLCLSLWPAAVREEAAAANTPENLCLLRAETGANPGDHVVYFHIFYQDTSGKQRNQYLLLQENAWEQSQALKNSCISEGSSYDRKKSAMSAYSNLAFTSETGTGGGGLLQSFTTTDLLFQTEYPMASVISIHILTEHVQGSACEWTCKSLELYQVDQINGYDMIGSYSNQAYLDFEGCRLAALTTGGNPVAYGQRAVSKLYTLSPEATQEGYHLDTARETVSSGGTQYFVKLDVADISNSAFSDLRQDATGNKALCDMTNLAEQLVVALTYQTIGGSTETLYIPAISSMLCYLLTEWDMGSAHLFGLGQQGDSIFFPVRLPNLKESGDISVTLYFGCDSAARLCSLPNASKPEENYPRVTGMQIYRNMPLSVEETDCRAAVTLDEAPVWYFTASTVEGLRVDSGSGTSFRLVNAAGIDRPRYTPEYSGTRYHVVITTDDVPNAGTAEDLFLIFNYVDSSGSVCTYGPVNVRNMVEDFYGDWPTEPDGGAYAIGAQNGQKLEFLINISNLKKFTGMTLFMRDGYDDYQFSSVKVYDVQTVSARHIQAVDADSMAYTGVRTGWLMSREITSRNCLLNYDRVTLIQRDSAKEIELGAGATEIKEIDDVDWEQYRYIMTYEDALQNMGYNKARESYEVTVKVHSDAESNLESGDSGSSNMFYFQLVFANGETSGYVLANQQIQTGRFRSGKEETFTISMNHDYGEVVAVRIIPDDTLNEGDSFDKLHLEYVEVTKRDSVSVNPVWRFNINGWIDIDYRDAAAKSTVQGLAGRSEGELARSYPVSSSSYSVNLLAEIEVTDAQDDYEGALYAAVTYLNIRGETVTKTVDVGRAMYEYQGRENAIQANTGMEVPQTNENLTKYTFDFTSGVRLDPDTMLRQGECTRFLLSLTEPAQIVSVNLYSHGVTASSRKFRFHIYKILDGTGVVTLDESGSYVRDYGEPVLLASGLSDLYVLLSNPLLSNGSASVSATDINLEDNRIEVSKDSYSWTSLLGREPASMNDELNVYVHMKPLRQAGDLPDTKNGDATDIALYDMQMQLEYSMQDATGRMVMGGRELSIGTMNKDQTGQIFYAKGISVSGITSLDGLSFHAIKRDSNGNQVDMDNYNCLIQYVVIERVRSGVVIETMYAGGVTYKNANSNWSWAELTPSHSSPAGLNAKTTQTVYLQLSEDSQPFTVTRDSSGYSKSDIAVSIQYHTTNMSAAGDTAISRNVFLSDLLKDGESLEVQPGDVLTYSFEQDCLDGISGISMTMTDDTMDVKLVGICVCTYNEDGSCSGCYGRADSSGFDLSLMTRTVTVTENGVVPVTVLLTTGAAEGPENTACRVPLYAKFVYEDSAGSERSYSVGDLRLYASEGGFDGGETASISLLLPEYGKIHYLALRLEDSDPGTIQSWKLEKVVFHAGGGSGTAVKNKQNTVNTTLYENTAFHVNLSDFMLAATVTPGGEAGVNTYGETLDFLIPSEGTVRATPCGANDCFAVGSFADVTVSAAKINGSAAKDCSECLFLSYRSAAGESEAASDAEGAVLESFLFVAPANYTDDVENYRITITSQEVSTKTLVINVKVEPGEKPEEEPAPVVDDDPVTNPEERIDDEAAVNPEDEAESEAADETPADNPEGEEQPEERIEEEPAENPAEKPDPAVDDGPVFNPEEQSEELPEGEA